MGYKKPRNSISLSSSCASTVRGDKGDKGSHEAYFAVPAQGQVFGVVNDLILFIFTFALADLLFLLLLSLFPCPGLLALYIFMSELSLFLGWVNHSTLVQHTRGHLLYSCWPLTAKDTVLVVE